MPPAKRPPRVTGSLLLVQRARGPVYYAKYRVPDPSRPDGVRQVKTLLGPAWTKKGRPEEGHLTKRTAQDALNDLLSAARNGELPEGVREATRLAGGGRTFKEACDAWLAYVEHKKENPIAPTTAADYRRTVRLHLLPAFGPNTPLASITKADVEEYRERLLAQVEAGKLTRPSAHKVLVLLNGVFRFAVRKDWITVNPREGVEALWSEKARRKLAKRNVLSPEEVYAVVRVAESEQDAAIFALAAFAGLRMGELRALRWHDVQFANRNIVVRGSFTHGRLGPPKSGEERSVPLIDQAAKALDGLSRREHFTEPGDLVFVSPTGGYVHEGDLRRRFYTALRVAGLAHKRDSGMTFHDLRHTFGTLAVQVWDLPKVQAYMGHSDIKTTMGYVHNVPKQTDADALGALVAAGADAEPTPART